MNVVGYQKGQSTKSAKNSRFQQAKSTVLHVYYTALCLNPIGKHLIRVCVGTACYVRGGSKILECINRNSKSKQEKQLLTLNFSLETVNCLGCCALGPVIEIDGQYFGKLKLR
jgi:NADH-quinone oxidoreductase subunit E